MALVNGLPRQRRQRNAVLQAGLWGSMLLVALLLVMGRLFTSPPVFSYALGLPSTPQLSLGIVQGCPAEVPAEVCALVGHQIGRRFEVALSEDGARHTLLRFDLPAHAP